MGHRRRCAQAHQAAVLAATQMQLAQTQAQLAQVQQQQYGKGAPPPYPGFIGYPNGAQQVPPVQSVTVVNHGHGVCPMCRRARRSPTQSLVRMAFHLGMPFHHRHHHYCHC